MKLYPLRRELNRKLKSAYSLLLSIRGHYKPVVLTIVLESTASVRLTRMCCFTQSTPVAPVKTDRHTGEIYGEEVRPSTAPRRSTKLNLVRPYVEGSAFKLHGKVLKIPQQHRR